MAELNHTIVWCSDKARIAEHSLEHWADPAREQSGAINRHWGGRGVYFMDPDGHLLEAITKPYGPEMDL